MVCLFLDSSGDWRYIAVVVCDYLPSLDVFPHVASYSRRDRERILENVLNFIDEHCYGVCLEANIRIIVRSIMAIRNNRSSAWRIAMTIGLRRILDHLRSKGFRRFDSVFADNEFGHFVSVIREVFETRDVIIGKNQYIVLPDVLAYANLKARNLLKKYRNIVEL